MILTINVPMLVVRAKEQSGLKLGEMAKEMHVAPARLSEWMAERGNPSTDQIAWMADKADLPINETLAALRPEWAAVWKKAAAQITSLYFALGLGFHRPRFSAR